jgi:hypothetical protein
VTFYVVRTKDGRTSYTGSIRSRQRVEREAAAWRDAGWEAKVEPTSPELRAKIRAWERSKRVAA